MTWDDKLEDNVQDINTHLLVYNKETARDLPCKIGSGYALTLPHLVVRQPVECECRVVLQVAIPRVQELEQRPQAAVVDDAGLIVRVLRRPFGDSAGMNDSNEGMRRWRGSEGRRAGKCCPSGCYGADVTSGWMASTGIQ